MHFDYAHLKLAIRNVCGCAGTVSTQALLDVPKEMGIAVEL